ncbi:MAG: aminopeptidase [Eubacteriales bacterium]|nr:aminopeptidase [Eubacteriales bacterium]
MTDERLKKLAKNLVGFSVNVQKGEKVLVELTGVDKQAAVELVREIAAAGGQAFVQINEPSVQRALVTNSTDEQLAAWADFDAYRMKQMDGYIGIRAGDNIYEMSDVPADRMTAYSRLYSRAVHTMIRVPHTKWVVLRYPTPAMAQMANMSSEQFEDFYFNVCNLDYARISRAMDPLKELMDRTDEVRMTGPGTDLTFSIKGIPTIKCDGRLNIPDGEIYTAPVRDSMNGVISYNTRSLMQGVCFENIRFEVKNGRIVKATANDTERINAILDLDEGARYFGEFAIGVNPYVERAMLDTLFDEKIRGSIHLTPGCSYDDAYNGNKSALHWDLVWIQTEECGGGDIYFDGKLVRHNGRFVLKELECLNPENLI